MLGRRNWIFLSGSVGLNVCVNRSKGRLLCATSILHMLCRFGNVVRLKLFSPPAILFYTTNKQAWYTIRLVLDEVFVDEGSDYDPDVEDRTSNSIEHVSEVGQDVNTDTSDETVFSGLQKNKTTFLSLFVFQ